jgi:hypothetical protein
MKAAEDHGRTLGWGRMLLGVVETKPELVTYYGKQHYSLTDKTEELEGAPAGTLKFRILSKSLVA